MALQSLNDIELSGERFFIEWRTHSHYHGRAPIYQSFSELKLPGNAFITHEMTLIESVNSEKCGGKRVMLQEK